MSSVLGTKPRRVVLIGRSSATGTPLRVTTNVSPDTTASVTLRVVVPELALGDGPDHEGNRGTQGYASVSTGWRRSRTSLKFEYERLAAPPLFEFAWSQGRRTVSHGMPSKSSTLGRTPDAPAGESPIVAYAQRHPCGDRFKVEKIRIADVKRGDVHHPWNSPWRLRKSNACWKARASKRWLVAVRIVEHQQRDPRRWPPALTTAALHAR